MGKYIIRDREAGNFIDEFETLEEACDELTDYVFADEADECDMSETDPNVIDERREKLMNFYEISDAETDEAVDIYWDANDNCVCF